MLPSPAALVGLFLLATALTAQAAQDQADARPDTPPLTYEVMINGETFQVEANRMVTVQSKETPGLSYRIAVRVAPVQRLKLNSLQLEYDQQTKVVDDRKPRNRGAKLQHELGFTMLITELGEPLAEANRDKALELLAKGVEKTLLGGDIKQETMRVSRLRTHQFRGAEGRGVRFDRSGTDGIDRSTFAYLLVGKTFTATCLVEFLGEDEADVLPLIRRTIESIRPLDKPADKAE